ncbi:MAG: PA14 domain-containing protein, partial [candidate division KSB1 bacterium]|nr:PA14 domain-containing protein [candidate division KSB1 bacterium]
AVLNSEFDYVKYLDEVQRSGQNLTRTFSGVYCEPPSAFNITRNTLAPAEGKLICPWARSDQPGYANGGNKFDLTKWDDAYFSRLKSFVAEADKRGIVVEYVFFCPMYEETMWDLSPMNVRNNVNGVGDCPRDQVYTLMHADLTRVQEALVRKVVQELNDFDNLYYEICNEPYFVNVTDEFQRYISRIIREAEAALPKKHLIARNIANNSAKIENPDPNVDIFNFHYAVSAAVDLNYHLNKPLGDDETGFAGVHDDPYRKEGWNFIVSGGAIYNHLDYSYAVGFEDGTFAFPNTQSGGGGRSLRSQLKIMREFIESFDFIKMTPLQDKLAGVPDGLNGRLLGQEGVAYIGYLYRKGEQAQNLSLRWSGKLIPEWSGEIVFYTTTDDGVRLWVDGRLLIDDWTGHAPLENSGRIHLQTGKPVDFVMEYYQGVGGAAASIRWGRGIEKVAIPARCFRQADGAPGLRVDYFDDTELKNFRQSAGVDSIFFSGDLKPFFPETAQTIAAALQIDLPAGEYHVQWLDPASGKILAEEIVRSSGGKISLTPMKVEQDLAFGIRRKK